MIFYSKDPILTAFELSWELKRLSRLENEFKVEYEAVAKQCMEFAVDLLDQTRGSKELECILNYDPAGPVNDGNDSMNLARLKLAIKYKQKRVCTIKLNTYRTGGVLLNLRNVSACVYFQTYNCQFENSMCPWLCVCHRGHYIQF